MWADKKAKRTGQAVEKRARNRKRRVSALIYRGTGNDGGARLMARRVRILTGTKSDGRDILANENTQRV